MHAYEMYVHEMHAHETHPCEICVYEKHELGRCREILDLSLSISMSRRIDDALVVIFGAKSSAKSVTDLGGAMYWQPQEVRLGLVESRQTRQQDYSWALYFLVAVNLALPPFTKELFGYRCSSR
jgi:hypothetical protein